VAILAPEPYACALTEAFPNGRIIASPVPPGYSKSTALALLTSMVSWIVRWKEIRRAESIVAASHFFGDVLPLAIATTGRRVVIVHHTMAPPWNREGPLARNTLAYVAERLSLVAVRQLATAIITSSQHVADGLRQAGYRQPVYITANAPDAFAGVPPPSSERRLGRVVCLGRLSPTKGLTYLLDAWRIVKRYVPNATLHIIGDGDRAYRALLERRAIDLGIGDSVNFLGRVSRGEKERELFEAALFAFPSTEEGFGIALVEAMAAGLPCVTFDLPVFRGLFDRGRIPVPAGDVERFAAAVIVLLKQEEARARLAAAALEHAQSFSWDRAAEVTLRALGSRTRADFRSEEGACAQ
jgi:glycosyltransferase involved in cell wall biosynthesis